MSILLEVVASSDSFQWSDKISIPFLTRFLVNLVSVFILIRFIYFRNYKRTDLFLTFFGFNVIIFLITFLLNKVEMSMGAAFGLFAVFSMLRYRTENINAKDMTYLFIAIAIGLITAISNGQWYDISLMAFIMLVLTGLLEGSLLIKKENTKLILYDKIDLITPEKTTLLIEDLKIRTGLNIQRVEINDIDFLKDAAQLKVYYFPEKN